MKKCESCLLFKEVEQFYKRKTGTQGLQHYCKDCSALKFQLWKKEHLSQYKKIMSDRQKRKAELINFHSSKRRAAKLKRIPCWLTESDWIEIKWAYKIARDLTKETGILHVVDHIIPLQGKNVSGLHCPQNLQVITGKDNNIKKNKFLPHIR